MISTTIASLSAALAARIAAVWAFYALATLSVGIGALLCYGQARPAAARSARDFLAFVFPRRVLFHPSARLDLWFMLVRWLTRPLFIAPFSFSSAMAGEWLARKLTLAVGSPEPAAAPPLVAPILLTLALLVATDFARFVAHYLAHRLPMLWEFHKVHHAAEVLIPPTVVRSHPVDELCVFLAIGSSTALVEAVFFYLYPMGVGEVTILGVEVYFIFYLMTFYPLRHSHLPLRFGAALESVLISPAMHQLHHGADPRLHGKNFGLALTLWDRLLGTLARPEPGPIGPLGLGEDEHRAYDSVWALYALPFVKLVRRCRVPLGIRLGRGRKRRVASIPRLNRQSASPG
jgi:sterol desaturase/sphingolipid hydroxylase (fatty acid hydroxylase superfamily)